MGARGLARYILVSRGLLHLWLWWLGRRLTGGHDSGGGGGSRGGGRGGGRGDGGSGGVGDRGDAAAAAARGQGRR